MDSQMTGRRGRTTRKKVSEPEKTGTKSSVKKSEVKNSFVRGEKFCVERPFTPVFTREKGEWRKGSPPHE